MDNPVVDLRNEQTGRGQKIEVDAENPFVTLRLQRNKKGSPFTGQVHFKHLPNNGQLVLARVSPAGVIEEIPATFEVDTNMMDWPHEGKVPVTITLHKLRRPLVIDTAK